jgi:hypothetical protein
MAQEKNQFLTLRQASSGALTNSLPTACDPRIAARLAAKLFGCYRASDANNPEVFLAAATTTLAQYPEHVAAKVCDPARGLPAENKWLPSIAEIRVACDAAMAPVRAEERREREREHTRGVLIGHKAPVGSPEHQRVVAGFEGLRPPDPVREREEKQFAYHREAAQRAPWNGTDAYGKVAASTPEMEKYLAGMREQLGLGLDLS